MSFDVAAVRRQFPILSQIIDGQPVHYLDNGASAQTPEAVLDAVRTYETTSRANVLRGVHRLAERATEAYENARVEVANFLSVDPMEIVFTGTPVVNPRLVKVSTSVPGMISTGWSTQSFVIRQMVARLTLSNSAALF